MKLDNKDRELIDSITDQHDVNVHQGEPETGSYQNLSEEDWRDSILEATLKEALRELIQEYVDIGPERDDETHPNKLLDPDNVEKLYITQYPWRAPFVAIELEECPDWANISRGELAHVRTRPAHPPDNDVVYFQVREGW